MIYLLAGGQRQRVAIARVLVNDPKIIVMDEPTESLSAELSKQVMKTLYLYTNQNHKTLIVVTHDIDKVRMEESRIIKLTSGTIKSDSFY